MILLRDYYRTTMYELLLAAPLSTLLRSRTLVVVLVGVRVLRERKQLLPSVRGPGAAFLPITLLSPRILVAPILVEALPETRNIWPSPTEVRHYNLRKAYSYGTRAVRITVWLYRFLGKIRPVGGGLFKARIRVVGDQRCRETLNEKMIV